MNRMEFVKRIILVFSILVPMSSFSAAVTLEGKVDLENYMPSLASIVPKVENYLKGYHPKLLMPSNDVLVINVESTREGADKCRIQGTLNLRSDIRFLYLENVRLTCENMGEGNHQLLITVLEGIEPSIDQKSSLKNRKVKPAQRVREPGVIELDFHRYGYLMDLARKSVKITGNDVATVFNSLEVTQFERDDVKDKVSKSAQIFLKLAFSLAESLRIYPIRNFVAESLASVEAHKALDAPIEVKNEFLVEDHQKNHFSPLDIAQAYSDLSAKNKDCFLGKVVRGSVVAELVPAALSIPHPDPCKDKEKKKKGKKS